MVGVSLKKLGPTANFKIMNEPDVAYMKKAENIVFDKGSTLKELTSFSAMDVYFCYGASRFKSFQARNFGGTSSGQWQFELKGEFAAQGKIKGAVMRKLLSDAKANISHIDCTLVGESPKIAKYTEKMCIKLAKTLKIQKDNISIKATTTAVSYTHLTLPTSDLV